MAEGICERKEPKLLLYQLMETGGRMLGRYCQLMWYSKADILCRLSSQKGINLLSPDICTLYSSA
jgi:hypothetical protein